MAKLYPPVIEGTIPAFYGGSITIPFSMNKAVSNNDIYGMSIKIKTVQNNLHLGTLKITWNEEKSEWVNGAIDLKECLAEFFLDEVANPWLKNLNIGQYYKVQMAYIGKGEIIGHYSTVGVIKKTSQPQVSIISLDKAARNASRTSYIGCYKQEHERNADGTIKQYADWTEKVYSYRFIVKDLEENIIADSGEQLHIYTDDDEPNVSYDNFIMEEELTKNSSITYTITTINQVVISQTYRLYPKQSVLPEMDAELRVSLNEENGYVLVTLEGSKFKDGSEKSVNGAFLLSRRKADEPGKWEHLVRFGLRSEKPSSWSWKDFTVEQGIHYIYSIQQYSDQLYSQRILNKICINEEKDIWVEKEIYVDFEHAFLFDGERQLKIKYNPKVSSFKTTLLESKIETLGSKHPFIFRNGFVSYKDFPISGLISYLMDEENLFINEDLYRASHQNIIRKRDDSSLPRENFKIRHTNLTSDNIQKERQFKLEVLNWLNNGKPKLFRSPTEGNYIVRLLNISLSPSDGVGRMLHSFSGNAYEIAEYNYENLTNNNFIRNSEAEFVDKTITNWATIELFDKYSDEISASYGGNILPKDLQVNELSFTGMLPGDRIKITYADEKNTSLEIIIGATGSYYATNIAPIKTINLWQANARVNGMVTYSFLTKYSNSFGLYHDAISIDYPARQIFGTDIKYSKKNIRNILEDLKTSILNVYYMSFEKRPIQIVYADAGKDIIVKDENQVDISLSNIYLDRYKTELLTKDKIDAYTIYKIHLSALDNETPVEFNQDYFLDNHFDHFFPEPTLKDKSFIDGLTGEIFAEKDYSTKVYIDPGVETWDELTLLKGIDLNETLNYSVTDLRPKQLFIGTGVMMTIGYCTSSVTYNFEVEDRYLAYDMRNSYDIAVRNYENALINYESDEAIQNSINLKKFAYRNLLDALAIDLKTYNEENGLGEDE